MQDKPVIEEFRSGHSYDWDSNTSMYVCRWSQTISINLCALQAVESYSSSVCKLTKVLIAGAHDYVTIEADYDYMKRRWKEATAS